MTRKLVQVVSAVNRSFQSYTLYPNPIAINGTLQLDVTLTAQGPLAFRIIDVNGQERQATHYPPDTEFTIRQDTRLSAGAYYCILESHRDALTIPFAVQ
jgi:hypothetical protein